MVALMISVRLCGGMLVAMPTAMPDDPLTSRFGTRVGRTSGSDFAVVVVGPEIDGFLVDVLQQRGGDAGEARLGVPHGRGRVAVDRAEVALPVHQRIAHGERLRHADQRVVDRRSRRAGGTCPCTSPVILAHLRVGRLGARPISCMPNRMRRCTGFSPSRTSGSARPTITLMA